MSRALRFACLLAVAASCGGNEPPGKTYYEREIEPILVRSCSGNTSGCHSVDPDDPFGFAAGNFDVTSFESVQKRRDVLQRFGPYPVPLLLIKAVGNTDEIGVNYDGEFRPLEVQHVGGPILQVGSDSYLTLLEWTQNGATENGLAPPSPPETGEGPCSDFVPAEFDQDRQDEITGDPNYSAFESDVAPVLQACSASTCHGAPAADFYITCGDDERQKAFNFKQARAFVDEPAGNSQLLRVPLAVGSGGFFHTGGEHFASQDDAAYQAIRDWAAEVGRVQFGEGDPGKEFFAEHVQPTLIERGCLFEACHSPQATNDFQLRSGSLGFFSAIALERNYEKLKEDFMALEVPDARRGRAVAKTILAAFGGIKHRGGPVLETPGSGGSDPASCPEPFDPDAASAFCVLQEWVDIERQKLIDAGDLDPLAGGDTVPIVYVERDESHVADVLEFDTYQGGSDLLAVDATIGPEGSLTVTGTPTSLLDGCSGTGDRSAVDVSGPDVRLDGTTVAFSMRTAQNEPRQIYTVNVDGSGCQQLTENEGEVDGVLIHNFDPAWSPDGEWIVYATTRGAEPGESPSPSRSRKLFEPQSDIYRMRFDDPSVKERVTYLTNSEISPQMMREGRIIMTTEKISEGFYQLSGRRINWDRTDYHPLLAQRKESPFGGPPPGDADVTVPSVGYERATELREGFDGNFLTVFSDDGVRGGAGTIAIFNRSVGTFEAGREDRGILESVTIPDRGATGRAGESTDGAYRSPFPLLDGRIMASYASYQGDLTSATSLDWDLVALDPQTGQREVLLGGAGAQVEAVLAIKEPHHEPFYHEKELVFGGKRVASLADEQRAILHFPDAPLIFTLLNANARRGRPAELFRDATHLALYLEKEAPPSQTSPNQGDIFQSRELLGRAPLEDDDSVRVKAPAGTPIILELQDADGNPVVTMKEEHQVGPGENISFGIVEELFDAVCGGCHGTVSGVELDVNVTPDALTGASKSVARDKEPVTISN